MKEKIFVLAYMGTGKTEVAWKYQNVIDHDFQDYKFVYDESIPIVFFVLWDRDALLFSSLRVWIATLRSRRRGRGLAC